MIWYYFSSFHNLFHQMGYWFRRLNASSHFFKFSYQKKVTSQVSKFIYIRCTNYQLAYKKLLIRQIAQTFFSWQKLFCMKQKRYFTQDSLIFAKIRKFLSYIFFILVEVIFNSEKSCFSWVFLRKNPFYFCGIFCSKSIRQISLVELVWTCRQGEQPNGVLQKLINVYIVLGGIGIW